MNPLAELQTRLTNAEIERQMMQIQTKAFEESLRSKPVEHFGDSGEPADQSHPQMVALLMPLARKREQLRDYSKSLVGGAENPFCKQMAVEIAKDEKAVELLRKELREQSPRNSPEKQLNARKDEIADAVAAGEFPPHGDALARAAGEANQGGEALHGANVGTGVQAG